MIVTRIQHIRYAQVAEVARQPALLPPAIGPTEPSESRLRQFRACAPAGQFNMAHPMDAPHVSRCIDPFTQATLSGALSHAQPERN